MALTRQRRQRPDSEVRIILRHPRLRTSESKDTSNLLILVWLWFRSPHVGLAARMMRTSEPPTLAPGPHPLPCRGLFSVNNLIMPACHCCGRDRCVLASPRRHGSPFPGAFAVRRATRSCRSFPPRGGVRCDCRRQVFSLQCMGVASTASAQAQWTEAKIPERAASRRARLCRGNPQSRRLGLHPRALRPARLAAKSAFLDPRTGYPGQHQARDRRQHASRFRCRLRPNRRSRHRRVPRLFPAISSRR